MDEQLISEVQNHAVIYNRQKYFLNNARSGKYESKEDAWVEIANKIGTDVDTCKKRWKYLRERYVQQRKQGDPPTYEHLSRPYLEKMKFLDQHIQPRKSYRNVSNFLSSPNGNNPFGDYIDSSRSNGSLNNLMCQNFQENLPNDIKMEPDQQSFQSFSTQNHSMTSQQASQLNMLREQSTSASQKNNPHLMPSSEFRENENYQVPSSSSSLKSPLSTPPTVDPIDTNGDNAKRPRLEANRSNEDSSENDDSKLRYNCLYNNKSDERLIDEVQNHGVIYNRQKYLLNNGRTDRYESKDEAWTKIAMKIGMDMDSCKKRWKYLRERYVQQRKQGDVPAYEHLSRPYLEKMKFLDQHIQPRKSYRNVSNFLSSPNGNNQFGDYMDSSRSNGSLNNIMCQNYPDNLANDIKMEPYQSFQNFSSENHPLSLQQVSQANSKEQTPLVPLLNHIMSSNEYRENESCPIPSSSSSLKSPLSSPPVATEHTDPMDIIKRPHIDLVHGDDSSENENDSQQNNLNDGNVHNGVPSIYPADFLFSMYQKNTHHRHMRSSEYLLGELVTSELLKMNKERRKVVQKRILEILFFEE